MANGDSSTTRVQFFFRDSKLSYTVAGLTGESFVNFEDVDILDAETGFLEGFWDSESGSDSHNLRRYTGTRESNDTSEDVGSVLLGNISTSKHNAGSAIGHLTRVSSGGSASLLESGLEFS